MNKKNFNEAISKILLGFLCIIFAIVFWLIVEFNNIGQLPSDFLSGLG